MYKPEEAFYPGSRWLTATPSAAALSLPFCLTEAGHFLACPGYLVERQRHESHLLLYTAGGSGRVASGGTEFVLEPGSAAVIDCRQYHKYCSAGPTWDFYWVHFRGVAADAVLSALYPGRPAAVPVGDRAAFGQALEQLLAHADAGTLADSMRLSCAMHSLFCALVDAAAAPARGDYGADVAAVVEFIRGHYAEPVTLDDMLGAAHVSKYYLIRRFRRIMGTTPYNYLMAYRINHAKRLLRATPQPVAAVAERCGFQDASNFIAQFKKYTGQTPAAYRRDFAAAPAPAQPDEPPELSG